MGLKKIIAGPFLGEFGWELMRWQGIFRKLHDKRYSITMVSRLGHEALYKDYIDDYIPARDLGFNETGSTDGWRIDGKVPKIDPLILKNRFYGYKYMDPLTCMKIGIDPLGSGQRFITFGKKSNTEKTIDIVIHARNTNKEGTNIRNWPKDKWQKLIWTLGEQGKLDNSKQYKMVCIGSPNAALHFSGLGGCLDYRGASLDVVIDLISNAKLVIGPSSGPMHLASLCGTPHLVWTEKDKIWGSSGGTSKDRYLTHWNPKNTKAYVIDDYSWDPPVEIIIDKIKDILK